MGFKQTNNRLFALLSSARSSGSAARCGAVAEAYSHAWVSYVYSSCSRVAAELAAHVGSRVVGAGYAASSAAHAAELIIIWSVVMVPASQPTGAAHPPLHTG